MRRRKPKGRLEVRARVKTSEKLIRLRSKGQVTVPAKQLALLNLRAGDQLISRVEGDRIVLGPVELTRRGPAYEPAPVPRPSRAQLDERRRGLTKIRPLTARDFDELEPVGLRGPGFTDEELEAAIGEGRE